MKPCKIVLGALVALAFSISIPQIGNAAMGECQDCHTMHNSQGNLPMRYDSGTTPLAQLLRGDCFGCHAQGGALNIITIGNSTVPQVYHTDTLGGYTDPGLAGDLAGGNFGYIDGLKGSGASDAKGHNIAALAGMGADSVLTFPPGGIRQTNHFGGGSSQVLSNELTCAGDPANGGVNGCHGNRFWAGPPSGITGSHHQNQSGSLNPGAGETRPGYGYRFLVGVKGYEDTDWQYTSSASDHNEYFGRNIPAQTGCAGGAVQSCHGAGGVRAPNGTMGEFCGTCHGNYHTLTVGTGDDTIGNSLGTGSGTSPWLRHPADLSLPAGGEFASYVNYTLTAPVARIAVPAGPSSSTVTPGSDAVMCLSCHVAHGSDYPDMLRFDYTLMDIGAGGAASGTGCFACHTSKD